MPSRSCLTLLGMVNPPASPTLALAVGDPVRRSIGRAVLGSLVVGGLFVLATLPAPELPTMWSNGPWAQDPYHVVVSFAVLFVPLVALLCMSRLPLCRRYAPLPTRRARDLLRVSRILLILVLATVAAAWISVAAPAQRYGSTSSTVAAFAELGVLTVALLWAGRLLWRGLKAPVGEAAGSDWLADVITLGERAASRLGALSRYALAILRWTDRRIVSAVRHHRLLAAAVLAAALGVAVAVPQGIQEGYTSGGYLLFFMVTALGAFAFTTVIAQHLGLVVSDHPQPANAFRKRLIHAAVAASASAPVAIAFRSVIWPALGISEQRVGWPDFNELVLGVAALTAVVTVVVESLVAASRLPGRRR
jgi:hypothetical protein